MSQKHQEPPDKEEELPNECPSCKTVEEKIVLHISRNKSCLSNIDPELYQKWKKISKRRSKRKYQAQYVASGEHGEAQARYVDTGKQKAAQKKYEQKLRKHIKIGTYWKTFWTPQYEEGQQNYSQSQNYLQIKRHNQSKYRNIDKIMKYEHDGEKRLKTFMKMCRLCLLYLEGHRKIPSELAVNRFHLVEGAFVAECDEVHAWLKDVDSQVLKSVIIFQKIVLVPKSRWISTDKKMKSNSEIHPMKDKFYTLIGKLQAYENRNTEDILIPDEYKCNKSNEIPWVPMSDPFSEDDELRLCRQIKNILGDDIEDLFDLLNLYLKDMNNLEIALKYAKKKQHD